jgi:hypothetical protein
MRPARWRSPCHRVPAKFFVAFAVIWRGCQFAYPWRPSVPAATQFERLLPYLPLADAYLHSLVTQGVRWLAVWGRL